MNSRKLLLTLLDRVDYSFEEVLDGLNDQQMGYSEEVFGGETIAQVAAHAYQTLLSFATVAAGLAWPGETISDSRRLESMAQLNALQEQVRSLVVGLAEERLSTQVSFPWGEMMTAAEAVIAGAAHALVHAGKIGAMRQVGGFPVETDEY
jgi:hypothetical protein